MLKSGLKLVLDTDWIINNDDSIIEDIVANCNVYEGSKYYYNDQYGEFVNVLQYFDVKLPLNHRYIMTYYNPEDDIAATIAFNTFGVEEEYTKSPDSTEYGYQALFTYYWNAEGEGVSGFDYPINISDVGIRLGPVYMGKFNLRIYQLD